MNQIPLEQKQFAMLLDRCRDDQLVKRSNINKSIRLNNDETPPTGRIDSFHRDFNESFAVRFSNLPTISGHFVLMLFLSNSL